jgi:argonaute-like protein implicated in RNA metabolism and viral defense
MLRQFSNPEEVKKKARYYNLNPVYESTRRNKKYMVFDGNKWIHFGAMGYEDFTKHHDKARLEAFRRRNWRWEFAPVYTPRWLSWHTLWT